MTDRHAVGWVPERIVGKVRGGGGSVKALRAIPRALASGRTPGDNRARRASIGAAEIAPGENVMSIAIGVIGAGSFGTALAKLMGEKGHDIRLWVFEPDLCERMKKSRVNDLYLPEVTLPPNRCSCSTLGTGFMLPL